MIKKNKFGLSLDTSKKFLICITAIILITTLINFTNATLINLIIGIAIPIYLLDGISKNRETAYDLIYLISIINIIISLFFIIVVTSGGNVFQTILGYIILGLPLVLYGIFFCIAYHVKKEFKSKLTPTSRIFGVRVSYIIGLIIIGLYLLMFLSLYTIGSSGMGYNMTPSESLCGISCETASNHYGKNFSIIKYNPSTTACSCYTQDGSFHTTPIILKDYYNTS
jgi:hypothetical protein